MLCRSGTGKSRVLKRIVGELPKTTPVLLVNARSDELAEYSRQHSKTKILSDFDKNKVLPPNSCLIVEDIVFLSTQEERTLRRIINYDSHHKRVKIFCVSHTIHKTKIYSMLPLFHYIVFTGAASNVPVARNTFDFFKMDKRVCQLWLEEFKKYENEGNYLVINCSTLKLFLSTDFLQSFKLLRDSEGRSEESPRETAETGFDGEGKDKNVEKNFQKLLEGHHLKASACAVFSILVKNLDPAFFDPTDFTISFKSTEGRIKKTSVVDYILCLVSPDDTPSEDVKVVHNFLTKNPKYIIPRIFYKNKFLLPQAI